MTPVKLSGPYFEDLRIGDTRGAPALTLTSGHAAMHPAVLGDRRRRRSITGAAYRRSATP